MGTLPEGIVTLLFTDVEGSTRLARKLGDARWAELLGEHRRTLRRSLSAHAGLEVDTQGDASFAVLSRATDLLSVIAVGPPIPCRTPASMSFYRHYLPVVRAALGPEAGRRARDEGRATTLDDALAYALEGLG